MRQVAEQTPRLPVLHMSAENTAVNVGMPRAIDKTIYEHTQKTKIASLCRMRLAQSAVIDSAPNTEITS